MARTDFRTPRLYISQDLATGAELKLDPQQTNYLVNVLRLAKGAPLLLFNGRDGEFAVRLAATTRKAASLTVGAQTRPQETPPDVDYLFAPLKHASPAGRICYLEGDAMAAIVGASYGSKWLEPIFGPPVFTSRRI